MRSFIILISAIILFASCNQSNSITAEQAVKVDTIPGQCPYLTKDTKGNTVISWVRMNGNASAFCYAVSNNGKTFGAPVVIPGSGNIQPHGENLPKIIFKPSGEIIALWGAANPNARNKYSGLVYYVQSFDNGKTWTAPKSLVSDTASYDQRYYDVALLPNGEAAIIWLDNRKTTAKEGSGLYFATTNGKNGFANDHLLSEPCCQCCRTKIYVDKNGRVHALFRGIQDSVRDMVHIVSVDGGKTFSPIQKISNDNWVIKGCPHTGPAMTENNHGIHFAWFTGGKNAGCFYTKSTDNGKTFVMHDSVSALGSHPQLTALKNGELLIAWDEPQIVNNQPARKIGIQKRSADGKSEGKSFITDEKSNASYPVIASLNDHASIVVYTKTEGDIPYVAYQVIQVK